MAKLERPAHLYKEQKDIVDIEMWIRTCAVLHNFLLDQPTDEFVREAETTCSTSRNDVENHVDDDIVPCHPTNICAYWAREELVDKILEFNSEENPTINNY
jgi:hypothetical protein